MTTPNKNEEKIAGVPASVAREHILKQKATATANMVPFPGNLREAYIEPQDVKVLGFTVRPFYDGDIDTLQALDHPLHLMLDKNSQVQWGDDIQSTRGQKAWNLCYLLTTPIEEVEAMVETTADWRPAFEKAARIKFRKHQWKDLVQLQAAIVAQFVSSFSTVVGMEETDEKGEKKTLSSVESPAPKTDTAG